MAKSLPPLTWFRAFEAAARHLSFTAAGAEIGMTQSAVSQQIKALETRLGSTLFLRRPRGLSLTDDGRRLLPQVGAALETLSAATAGFEAGPRADLLTIAASVSVTQWMISPRLADFTSAHPNVRLRFLSTIWPDDFHAPRADVEIRFGSRKQVGQGAVELQPSGLVALKPPTLGGPLSTLPLIEAVGTSGGWSRWRDIVGDAGQPTLFVDSFGMALQLAARGHGVALVSEILASDALRTGMLERAHDARLPAQEGYFLWHANENSHAKAFADWVAGMR
ncbi:LysR family transcriptional regulator [uncultured Tateyamaria sp.]|uniref:LysR family transcriptional regulator n=1 Tax=uncultured Tateyamaria sp. TaxID=455651 RepID=UPI0026207F02|nr:LysR family transcriptional regulator [uncultured Tateyamaria sp.]